MSEEEKRLQIVRFLSQKREQFSINILCSLLQNNPGVHPEIVLNKAVDLADGLMQKLYPMEREDGK